MVRNEYKKVKRKKVTDASLIEDFKKELDEAIGRKEITRKHRKSLRDLYIFIGEFILKMDRREIK